MTRAPRETRASEARSQSWRPADNLPMPDPVEGYKFRYVRVATLGEPDPQNVWKAKREGWEFVSPADMPEFAAQCGSTGDMIEMGGLALAKLPTSQHEAMMEYYQERSDSQTAAVDQTLKAMEDPRMPLYRERKTTTTFGHRK